MALIVCKILKNLYTDVVLLSNLLLHFRMDFQKLPLNHDYSS